jgi:site-specific DNA recombinase
MERCIKCGYECIGITKHALVFCNVCIHFCPNDPEKADEYIQEKVDGEALKPLRKFSRTRGEQQKSGMIKKASKGKAMSRAPFGYILEKGHLIPAQNFQEVEEIFEEFLEDKMTLNKLAKKHNLSVNGLKKILNNFTYIGKIKFNNQMFDGTHKSIVSPILFNKVQDKLEKIKKKSRKKSKKK